MECHYDYIIYTDGSCLQNPDGPGGYACLVLNAEKDKILFEESFGELSTTNNRMELKAVILGLSLIETPSKIKLITDSKYIVNAFNQQWVIKWQVDNWQTSKKIPVSNQDLWFELLNIASFHNVDFEWTKGHENDSYNNYVDKLARDAAYDIVFD